MEIIRHFSMFPALSQFEFRHVRNVGIFRRQYWGEMSLLTFCVFLFYMYHGNLLEDEVYGTSPVTYSNRSLV